MPDPTRRIASRRGAYTGVSEIFRFNWHFYAATLAVDLLAVLLPARFFLQEWIRLAFDLAAALSTFWAVSSLLVSHYIYDRSGLYRWSWLTDVLQKSPAAWANIHAGLDQTSDSILQLFPGSCGTILDIYLPSEMSEPSIARARNQTQSAPAAESANPFALPLADSGCDTIFLIFAAHELRRRDARLQFFCEVFRALKPGACVVLVEHLRDWKNFLAYGPGAFHFFSAGEWLTVSSQAGLHVIRETHITPFIQCFVFSKPQ